MGLAARMKPFIRDALLEIPQSMRQETSDALCEAYDFDDWRETQDPQPEDTPALRANFISEQVAKLIFRHIKGVVRAHRKQAADASLDSDLDNQGA